MENEGSKVGTTGGGWSSEVMVGGGCLEGEMVIGKWVVEEV